MGHTAAWPHLYKKRPTASLVSKKVLTSLIGQIIINSGFQFIAYWAVHQQSWYVAPVFDPDGENIMCYENTVLFLVSSYQYILVAVVFSVGPPYRKPLWTNDRLVLTFAALIGLTTYFVLFSPPSVMDIMELETLPISFKWFIVLIAILNLGISLVCEKCVFPKLLDWVASRSTKSGYTIVGKTNLPTYRRVMDEMGLSQ